MRTLIDIAHPAHVHFFKHIAGTLTERGHQVAIVAREKDVTRRLLDAYGLDYGIASSARGGGRVGQAFELFTRDIQLGRAAFRFRPDVIVTRSPAGAQVGRLLGIRAVFDTDDGSAAGLHYQAAARFAHVITTPDCTEEHYGKKHVKYPGYKQTAYLHPEHFTPNPAVLEHLGVARDEPFFLLRFVAMTASHDGGEAGLSTGAKIELLARLSSAGRVFISSEGPLPTAWERHRFDVPAELMHDALAFASLLVGDSQTMAAEAAVLGTPNIRVSSWKGRLAYLDELEHRYELTESLFPGDEAALLARVSEVLAAPQEHKARLLARREHMLKDKVNVADWFSNFIESGAPPARRS